MKNTYLKLLLIFVIILLSTFHIYINGNETMYSGFTVLDYNKGVFIDQQKTRIIYDHIIKTSLSFLSLKTTILTIQIILSISFSYLLFDILKLFNIATYHAIISILGVFLFKQSYFGESSLLVSVEPKNFAYLLLLLCLLKNNYKYILFFFPIITLIHPLIGIQSFAIINIAYYLGTNKVKSYALVNLAIIIFIIYLFSGETQFNGLCDWKDVYLKRHVHHLDIFNYVNIYQILLSFVLLLGIIILQLKVKFKSKTKTVFKYFSIIGISTSLLFLLLNLNQDLLNFISILYPYRLLAISTLLSYIVIYKRVLNNSRNITLLVAFISSISLTYIGLKNIYANYNSIEINYSKFNLIEFLEESKLNEGVILCVDGIDIPELDIYTKHQNYFSNKIIPTSGKLICDWDERRNYVLNWKQSILKKEINYIIAKTEYEIDGFTNLYQNKKYNLYIKDE